MPNRCKKGIDEGARPVLRGTIEGNVATPTIFADVKPDMWVAQHEMFRTGGVRDAL